MNATATNEPRRTVRCAGRSSARSLVDDLNYLAAAGVDQDHVVIRVDVPIVREGRTPLRRNRHKFHTLRDCRTNHDLVGPLPDVTPCQRRPVILLNSFDTRFTAVRPSRSDGAS